MALAQGLLGRDTDLALSPRLEGAGEPAVDVVQDGARRGRLGAVPHHPPDLLGLKRFRIFAKGLLGAGVVMLSICKYGV